MTVAIATPAQATIAVRTTSVYAHAVRIATWTPGGRYRARVTYGAQRSVAAWAGADNPRTLSVAALNGGTWTWGTNRPVGVVRVGGVFITRWPMWQPAVGFLPDGGVVFGAPAAIRKGARNILAGEAYLVRDGRPITSRAQAPYAGAEAFSCGPRGTDGYGCFRSVVARYRSGKVGILEVAYATMPAAAKLLTRLGVVHALTMDSGGSAIMWTRSGSRGTCADLQAMGGCFGIARSSGLGWERPVPDAVVVYRIGGRRHP